MTRAARVVAACLALATFAAGCSAQASRQPSSGPPSIQVGSATTSPSAVPAPSSPAPQPIGATGTLVARENGTGPALFQIGATKPGMKITLRLTCIGPGTVVVSDTAGALVLGTGGCHQGVIFGSSWTRSRHDGGVLRMRVDASTSWAVEIWTGTVPDHSLTV
jgi:hypothetical protein